MCLRSTHALVTSNRLLASCAAASDFQTPGKLLIPERGHLAPGDDKQTSVMERPPAFGNCCKADAKLCCIEQTPGKGLAFTETSKHVAYRFLPVLWFTTA
jgi:hypothetical protein